MNSGSDVALVVFSLVSWFASLLGLPPEPRDPALLRAAPAETLVYLEWAPRGAGIPDGKEFEGLVADPEIVSLFQDAEASLRRLLIETVEGTEAGDHIPDAIPAVLRVLLLRGGSFSVRFDQELVAKTVQQLREQGTELPVERQGLTGLVGTLILQLGDQPEALERQLANTLRIVTQGAVQGEKLDRTALPSSIPGHQILLHRHQGYLIVATHEAAIDQAIAGLDGKDQGLSTQPQYREAMEGAPNARIGSVLWIDSQRLLKAVSTGFGLPGVMTNGVVTMLGLERLESITSVSGIREGKVFCRNWIRMLQQTSKVMAIASGKGITKSRFDLVPLDADVVLAGSLDIPKWILEWQKLAKGLDREEKFHVLSGLQSQLAELDLSLEELLQPFADNAILYDAPGSGGLLLSGPVCLLEVKDHEQAGNLIERLVIKIRESLPPFDDRSRGVQLGEGEFLGEKIYFLNQSVRKPVKINPAFCLTKDSLVIGLHPQSVKAHLRMLADKNRERFSARFDQGNAGEIVPAGDLLLVRYLNLQTVGKLSGPFLPYGEIELSSRFQMMQLDLTVLNLPSTAAILPYLKEHLSFVARDETGIRYSGEGSLPPQMIDTLLLFLPVAGVGVFDSVVFNESESLLKERNVVENHSEGAEERALKTSEPAGETR